MHPHSGFDFTRIPWLHAARRHLRPVCPPANRSPRAFQRHSQLNLPQVLQGLSPREWAMIRQVVVEVHSDTLLQHVTAALNDHFACIVHEQGKRMRGTQLHMVYATCPKHPP